MPKVVHDPATTIERSIDLTSAKTHGCMAAHGTSISAGYPHSRTTHESSKALPTRCVAAVFVVSPPNGGLPVDAWVAVDASVAVDVLVAVESFSGTCMAMPLLLDSDVV